MPDDQFLRYAEAGASPEELSRALQAMARGEGFVSVSVGVVTVIVRSAVRRWLKRGVSNEHQRP